MKSYNSFCMSHLRDMLNSAYDHVEEMRKDKAEVEQVKYVPNPRPTDLMQEFQILQELEKLRVEKGFIMAWRQAGGRAVNLDHNQVALLAETMLNFGLNFALTPTGGFQIG